MPIAIDGSRVDAKLSKMNCGGTPLWDHGSGCAYRCDTCNAVIGSIGQSGFCKELNKIDRKELINMSTDEREKLISNLWDGDK